MAEEQQFVLEVCVDSVKSAINAANGGAHRLELCQDLSVGGVTPSLGLFKEIKKKVKIPIFVLIRPRPGNFIFNTYDTDVMAFDIKEFVQNGADGIVIGALTSSCEVDKDVCTQLIHAAQGLPVTFNRAFDLTVDVDKALEELIDMGCRRVLTSGISVSCINGTSIVHDLIQQAAGRIIVVPAGGISPENVRSVLIATEAQEIHASASILEGFDYYYEKVRVAEAFSAVTHRVCSTQKVWDMVQIGQTYFKVKI